MIYIYLLCICECTCMYSRNIIYMYSRRTYICIHTGHIFDICIHTGQIFFHDLCIHAEHTFNMYLSIYIYVHALRIEPRRMMYMYIHHTYQSIWYSHIHYESVNIHACIHIGLSHPGWHTSMYIYLLCNCWYTYIYDVSVNIHICIHLGSSHTGYIYIYIHDTYQ